MRLFVAIDVPEAIKEHLSFLQRSHESRALRYVHPRNIHLTLNFLGERGDLDAIVSSLRSVSFSPFTLHLADIGCFPHEDDPQVVWVGLAPSEELLALQRQIDVRFTPQKSFKAHLTLARMRRLPLADRVSAFRGLERSRIKPIAFKVSSFRLYKSTLTSLGPVYEVVESFRASL